VTEALVTAAVLLLMLEVKRAEVIDDKKEALADTDELSEEELTEDELSEVEEEEEEEEDVLPLDATDVSAEDHGDV
jgi:hypothetical protein